jgi:hypothetical protein
MDKLPHPRNLCSILIAGILFLVLLPACRFTSGDSPNPVSRQHPWADALRALDPADTTTSAHDLTAVYLQQQDDALLVRVDVLNFDIFYDLSIDIQINDASAPGTEPYNIHIPSESLPARGSLDPLLDIAIVTIPLSEIPSRPRVNVSTPEDEITNLTLDGPVPTQTAPLLLTFYDTFAARFPAEALRSWDGAHTGPRGERHGLKHLLDAAEEYQTPVVLLDLKEPANLSALDAMDLLPRIYQMEQESTLILPNQSEQEMLFGFSPSMFMYSKIVSRSTHNFAFTADLSHIYCPRFSQTTIIPIAIETDVTQPTADGPSLEVRRTLLETALNADEKDLLVLGGSFPDTTWGSPDMVASTLAYFASRPYIHILDAETLHNFPTQPGRPDIQSKPETPPDEISLQSKTALEYAKSWAENPPAAPVAQYQPDPSFPYCVLSNEAYLAMFDPQGARLTYLFAVGRDGIPPYNQLIGPSWQVAPGIDIYPGALTDADDPFKPYEPTIEGISLVFTSLDGTRIKTFSLSETGLDVEYQTQEPITTQIPLLVDPNTRFTPGWAEKYVQEKTPAGVAWGLENGLMVSIQVEGTALSLPKGPITMRAFNESLSLLARPEDPDFDYPPGHYVPFPMAIAEIEMQDGLFLRLERLP